jgi:glycosyltransferase involved in cell wall biosynthesis
VLRVLKFAKYLPHFGWLPTIVAAHPDVYERELIDHDLAREVEGTPVWRPWYPGPWMYFSRAQRPGPLQPSRSGGLSKLRSAARDLLLPNLELPWVAPAFLAVRRAHRLWPADAILTSSPPAWAHLVGYLAKRLLGIPWVVDFRDQWAGNPVYSFGKWQQGLERRLERTWLGAADAIVTATPSVTAHYSQKTRRHDVRTITNGYDAEDFRGLENVYPKRFTVTYVGTLGHSYNPMSFLNSWRGFLSRRGLDGAHAVCRFVGHSSRIDFEREVSGDDLLRGTVHFQGFVPHAEALSEMASASVLLLLLSDDRLTLTAKLFEYLGARKPILAVIPSGGLADLLAARRLGSAFRPEDHEGIISELERLYDRHVQNDLGSSVDPLDLAHFERRHLTGALAKLLDEVVGRPSAR